VALRKRGIEVSRRSLFSYRKSDPRATPTGFDAVDDWARFILERQVFCLHYVDSFGRERLLQLLWDSDRWEFVEHVVEGLLSRNVEIDIGRITVELSDV